MATEQPFDVDLFVIGAGSGGLAAAKRAAGHGARVAVAEASRVGGTCVIRGCIPKKLMVYASQLGQARALAHDFGWAAAPPGFDWDKLCRLRDQVVNNLELAHSRHLAQAGVALHRGRARLEGPQVVAVGEARLRCRHVLLACGGSPVLPRFAGSDGCLVSDDFFALPRRPARAVLVGGGYIAIEFACLLQSLGCATTLVVRSHVLRGFDRDIRVGVGEGMRRHGVDVREQTQVRRVEHGADGAATVHLHGPDGDAAVDTDCCVLFAIGRRPNTAELGCEAAGVRLGEHGAVLVDSAHRTNVASVAALGDAIDRVNLTPVAIRAGRSVADRLFAGRDVPVSYDNVPTAVFGQPQVGCVGLTEEAARRALGDAGVRVYRSRFIPLLYTNSPSERKHAAIMKLVVDAASDRVLGFHMLGDDAPEIVQGFAAALQAGITKAQLDATTAVHPTQAEEFVLMR